MSKRVLWAVEYFIDGEWRCYADAVHTTRSEAREHAKRIFGAVRIRKYIPAD